MKIPEIKILFYVVQQETFENRPCLDQNLLRFLFPGSVNI